MIDNTARRMTLTDGYNLTESRFFRRVTVLSLPLVTLATSLLANEFFSLKEETNSVNIYGTKHDLQTNVNPRFTFHWTELQTMFFDQRYSLFLQILGEKNNRNMMILERENAVNP